jgi:hypothetical protein
MTPTEGAAARSAGVTDNAAIVRDSTEFAAESQRNPNAQWQTKKKTSHEKREQAEKATE